MSLLLIFLVSFDLLIFGIPLRQPKRQHPTPKNPSASSAQPSEIASVSVDSSGEITPPVSNLETTSSDTEATSTSDSISTSVTVSDAVIKRIKRQSLTKDNYRIGHPLCAFSTSDSTANGNDKRNDDSEKIFVFADEKTNSRAYTHELDHAPGVETHFVCKGVFPGKGCSGGENEKRKEQGAISFSEEDKDNSENPLQSCENLSSCPCEPSLENEPGFDYVKKMLEIVVPHCREQFVWKSSTSSRKHSESSTSSLSDLSTTSSSVSTDSAPSTTSADTTQTPSRVLLIGLGGGMMNQYLQHRCGKENLDMDTVELNPKVVSAAQQFFGFSENEKNRVHIAEGGSWVESYAGRFSPSTTSLSSSSSPSSKKSTLSSNPTPSSSVEENKPDNSDAPKPFDIITVDCFGDKGNIPESCISPTFVKSLKIVASPGGIVVQNVWEQQIKAAKQRYSDVFGEKNVEAHLLSVGNYVVKAQKVVDGGGGSESESEQKGGSSLSELSGESEGTQTISSTSFPSSVLEHGSSRDGSLRREEVLTSGGVGGGVSVNED